MDKDNILMHQALLIEPEAKNIKTKKDSRISKSNNLPECIKKAVDKECMVIQCLIFQTRNIYYMPVLDGNTDYKILETVLIETERGYEIAKILSVKKLLFDNKMARFWGLIHRRVTSEDLAKDKHNRELEKKAFKIARKKIKALGLNMKLIRVYYLLNAERIMFYFTAPQKIDFRELVKQLATIFRTRIELRQIGVRDETRLIGGLGPCGQHICCNRFFGDFHSVSMKMAKDQNLVLNPTKISGICGRLLCCLNYENDVYLELSEGMPAIGDRVVHNEKE